MTRWRKIERAARLAGWAAFSFAWIAFGLTCLVARWWLRSPDFQGIVSNITVVTRHAETSLGKADELTAKATESADQSIKTQKAAVALVNKAKSEIVPAVKTTVDNYGTLARNVDTSLTDKDRGAIVQLAGLIHDLRVDEDDLYDQAKGLLAGAGYSIEDFRNAIQALTALETDPEGLAGFMRAAKAAGVDAAGLIHDLRYPQKPAAWLRAVNILLTVLRGTQVTRQAIGQ